MKKIFLLFILMLAALAAVSCGSAGDSIESTDTDTGADTEEVLAIYEGVECSYHHRDYHVIPYPLIKKLGVDKCNAWAEKAREGYEPTDDATACPCPEFNIKAFIDDMKISRADFVAYGDLVYWGTFDVDVLYGMSPAEVDEYYVYSDELLKETIRAQHYAFIEKHFTYEYSSELYDMIVYDEALSFGVYPSVPVLVQEFGIDREEFEAILDKCTEKNERVYGESLSFEYDLDMIWNEDGSYKELPKFDGLTAYETQAKLTRIFCGVDE